MISLFSSIFVINEINASDIEELKNTQLVKKSSLEFWLEDKQCEYIDPSYILSYIDIPKDVRKGTSRKQLFLNNKLRKNLNHDLRNISKKQNLIDIIIDKSYNKYPLKIVNNKSQNTNDLKDTLNTRKCFKDDNIISISQSRHDNMQLNPISLQHEQITIQFSPDKNIHSTHNIQQN